MGTPEIAVPSLLALADRYEVVGLFCQPDKPVGRKQVITPPATKVAAEERGIPVFQPKGLRNEAATELIRQLSPDLIVVMAYGKILPKILLDFPKYGCINAHASLLPKYRGAAPIQYALRNGDEKTGITIMQMDEGVDTGDILAVKETLVAPEDDAESMFQKLALVAAELLPKAVAALEAGELIPKKQDESLATFAPTIEKQDGVFDFQKDAREIVNLVRGLCIWPVASFALGERTIKLFKAAYVPSEGKPGEVLSVKPLIIAAGNGAVELKTVMPAGKNKMDGTAFAAGLRLKKGDFLL